MKLVGKKAGSPEGGENMQLSHQEPNVMSPCNCENSVVVQGTLSHHLSLKQKDVFQHPH